MPLGSAVWAGAGRLRLAGIIHVAGIDLLWRASHRSIRASVSNALPIIDSGSGGYRVDEAIILETLGSMDADLAVILVRH